MEYYKTTNSLLSSIPKEFITEQIEEFVNKYNLTREQKQAITPIIITSKMFNDFFRNNYHKSTRYLKMLYNVPLLSLGNIAVKKNLSYMILPLYYIYQFQEFLARETKIVLNLKELKTPKNLDNLVDNFIKFGQGNLDNTLHIQNKVYLKSENKVLYYDVKNQLLLFRGF